MEDQDLIQQLSQQFMDNIVALSNQEAVERPVQVDDATWRVMGTALGFAQNALTLYIGVALDNLKSDEPPIGPEAMTTTEKATKFGTN